MAEIAAAAPVEPTLDVLAFARDRDSRAFLETYLPDATSAPARVEAGGPEQAVAALEALARPPRLLIVDIGGIDTPLSEMDRLAEACDPGVVVLAVGERADVHLFRELIRSGVADYVMKPLSADLLDPYVRERREQLRSGDAPTRRGRLVAFAGARGGAGATTLAVAVAWRLANVEKRRVALVDLDLHGGAAAVQLGLPPGGLASALDNHARIDPLFLEQSLAHHGPRLSLYCEEAPLGAAARVEPGALDDVLAALSESRHYVIVDLPRSLDAVHAHVLRAARARVLVGDRTLPALRDAARILALMRESRAPTLFALNDHHPGLAGLVTAEAVREAVGRAPDFEIGYDAGAARRGDNLGDALGEGSGPIARAAAALVARLTGRPQPKRRRWLGLFARSA